MTLHRVTPGTVVKLTEWDPDDKSGFSRSKKEGKAYLRKLNEKTEALQELLYAEGKHKILIVLQATDTGGKDGTIRHVLEGVNPQGVKVASFKKPTPEELSHDYLWRIHQHTPGTGEITVFNRSHYEDVLVVRVHNYVPETTWQKRYEHINAFEKMLSDEGTLILKFYLNISKDEQKARLQERIDTPEKNWKFAKGDLAERALWGEYQAAFEDMLTKTSTEAAPWHIVPANRKWYRNIVVSEALIAALESLDMQWPEAEEGLSDIEIL